MMIDKFNRLGFAQPIFLFIFVPLPRGISSVGVQLKAVGSADMQELCVYYGKSLGFCSKIFLFKKEKLIAIRQEEKKPIFSFR